MVVDPIGILVIILAGIGGGTVGHWLVLLTRWAWDRRPHGLSGQHDWIEYLAFTGPHEAMRLTSRHCPGCGKTERWVYL